MDNGRFHKEALKLLFEKRMAEQLCKLHRKGSVLMDVPKYRSFDELVEAADEHLPSIVSRMRRNVCRNHPPRCAHGEARYGY